MSGTPGDSQERGAFARRLQVLCAPLVRAGWEPVPTNLIGDHLYTVVEHGPDGRGMPALFRRGGRCVQVTAFEHGGLRVDPPFAAVEDEPTDPDFPVNALAAPAGISAAALGGPDQPGRFYAEVGLLP